MTAATDRFAAFVATLGRGPGRGRALTAEEAREAMAMLLAGEADPHQVGAFLMLLRYRGEDADEATGLVAAARAGLPSVPASVALDWPSYGAGRTRGAPWFLLAALALARAGFPVLMHGDNRFSSAMSVAEGLEALGLVPAADAADAARALRRDRFAYLPIAALSPRIAALLGLRALFGLRSPVNTLARLLDPGNAAAGVDGVFHPAYLAVHLGVAARLGRPRLAVLKGGGGEAERNPARALRVLLHRQGANPAELEFAALPDGAAAPEAGDPAALLRAVWQGTAAPPRETATVRATIALGLLATGAAATPEAADREANAVWRARR